MRFKTGEKRRFLLLILGLLWLCLSFAFAKGNKSNKSNKGNQENYLANLPEFSSPPKIDGILDNPEWKQGLAIETFTQFEPLEGSVPSEKTKAYLGYDENNLYVAFRCFDSNPKAIRASLTQRDKSTGDDEVTIYLDTFNDKKRAFVFQVNPCGIQNDGIFTEGTGRRRGGGRGSGGFERFDRSWDTYFLADACMDEEGYTVEMAIPFKSLRFPNSNTQRWGIKFVRSIRRKNEEIYWPPHTRDVNGFLVQAGTMEINGSIEKGKNIEIMPTLTGLKQSGLKFDPEAGLNFKWGVTSDITFDAAYNPDFSQVEADMPQIDVNQRYPLYYPEKRPFFLEGKDYFDTPFEIVYTRKIVNPQFGLKLTGKTKGTTVGFLSSLDQNPFGIEIPNAPYDFSEGSFQGLANVFRLKKDFFSESYLGIIATDKEIGTSWGNLTSDYNRVAGVDGHFKFLNYNRFSFQAVGSVTRVGTEKTDFVPAYTLGFSHNSRHLQLSADWTSIPPDFEASLGFFRRKDIRFFSSRAGYAFLPQNDLIISIRPSVEYRRIYDFNNTLTDDEYSATLFVSGWRQTHMFVNYSSGLERYNGVNFYPRQFMASVGSEPLSWLSGNVRFSVGDGIYYSDDPYLGYETGLSARVTLRPFSNLNISYDFQNDKFYKKKGGENVYKINIISQRINYQVSRPLSLRLITDYSDYDKELYLSFLLSYEYRPGTVFYFGVDDNRAKDEKGIFRGTGRYYFIKFSYWWRV